jgi:hypothetical protein
MTWPLNLLTAAVIGAAIIIALEASAGWLRVVVVTVAVCIAVGRTIFALRQNRGRSDDLIARER